ncbi:MAG: VOC family protein [Deltaproteobacteria bacterium]|nr:VOC family protein [Deltaproteobacteria bacterium]MCW5805022.1 VOC family protein [Deltaproteobacteria bacterium]
MKTLTPYLSFQGTCEAALALYADALGGKVTELKRFGDAPPGATNHPHEEHIMHARFEAEGIRLMASDGRPSDAATTEAAPQITLSLELADRDEQQRAFDKLAAGGKVTMPLADQFWGARFGMLVDRFGIHWMLHSDAPK